MVLCCGCYSELFDSQREFLAVKAFARAYRFEMSDQKIARFEIRPRKDHRGVDLISDALPFGLAILPRFSEHFPLLKP